MQKWEFKRVFEKTGEGSYIDADGVRSRKISALSWEDFDIDENLEDLGPQGWELVGFTSELNRTHLNYVFKRLIEE